LFGVWGGGMADRFPKRRVLLTTQVMLASLAGILALLAVVHTVAPWTVYLIAFLLGMVSVVDNPTGQSYVVELVGPDQLRNAISINSSVFQLGGFVGPALAGVTINALGVGYAFALNSLSYLGPIVALVLIRESELIAPATRRSVHEPKVLIRRIVSRPEILTPLLVVAVICLFAPNLPVTLAVLARVDLHGGAGLYGVLGAVVAGGSVLGALYSARRTTPRMRTFLGYAGLVMTAYLLAAAAPNEACLVPALLGVGATTVLVITSANSMIQLNTPRGAQGRVMGLYSLVVFGGATVGGPLLGMFEQAFGARLGLLAAAVIPGLAVLALLRRSHAPAAVEGPAAALGARTPVAARRGVRYRGTRRRR
jgi:MFS family permease